MHITYIFIKRWSTEKGKHYFMSLGQVLLPFHAYFRKILHNVTIPVFEAGYWVAKELFTLVCVIELEESVTYCLTGLREKPTGGAYLLDVVSCVYIFVKECTQVSQVDNRADRKST